jgi:flagellum-specific ATP synthase
MATHKEAEDLINIGAYVAGSNGKIDYAISQIEAISEFLQQGMNDAVGLDHTVESLMTLLQDRRQATR